MATPSPLTTLTLGECAHQAIRKHFGKVIKYESEVLADRDPEPLHQMRVGMRRLRTALRVFEPVVVLPKAASQKKIGQIARILGAVRDLDVLLVMLEQTYEPQLPKAEQKQLHKVIRALKKRRRQDFAEMEQLFESELYQKFLRSYHGWLEEPEFGAIAPVAAVRVVPDVLLPLVSHLFLHPGWLVGARLNRGVPEVDLAMDADTIHQVLADQGEVVHDLRKQIKRVRYQTEFFTDFYDASYEAQIRDFKHAQDALGHLQDGAVLQALLSETLGKSWTKALPSLAQEFQAEQVRLWQAWLPLQERFLDVETQDQLRETILRPQGLALEGRRNAADTGDRRDRENGLPPLSLAALKASPADDK